jgi:hypothetical protein
MNCCVKDVAPPIWRSDGALQTYPYLVKGGGVRDLRSPEPRRVVWLTEGSVD